MNLTNSDSKLPYIILPESNLKVLIDTGSTRSFVNPTVAKKYFQNHIKYDPFKISTAHGTSTENFSTKISLSKIFKISLEPFKFYLFDFHKYFDCLLGIDNLALLKASVDLQKNTIKTPRIEIPLNFHNINNSLNLITIEPHCEQVIKINIKNVKDGEILIPCIENSDLEIPECIAVAKNHQAFCVILNKSAHEKVINVSEPLYVTDLNEYDTSTKSFENLNNFETQKLKFDISKIRTEHMNTEEKEAILKLLKEYSDIFHVEGNHLTFTNKIKHRIRTSDEIPVYTKTYRYPEIHRREVQMQIQEMLNQKIIRPSYSPWSSPIWIVPKKIRCFRKEKMENRCRFP